ncbi:hypothetical protein V6N13_016533 [Hibiscus sabdariffa]|uniref:Import inner membrane translocase subunit n=2 Tax=Hibiscus sabdariffa TaxID=183260 RepID=A0ABR2NN81_9ROSI
MWKPSSSSSRLASALLKHRSNRHQAIPFSIPSPPPNVIRQAPSNPTSPKPAFPPLLFRSFHHQPQTIPLRNLHIVKPNPFSPFGSRLFSSKSFIQNPGNALKSTLSGYREAVGLQFDAFFKRNYLFLFGVGGALLCVLLWRIMFGIASTFVSLSEGMAKYGFLALSLAMVAFAGLYIRSRLTTNPDKVYRMAMRRLNTAAEILQVMGAPLTGTDLRAYVMSGGGLTLKSFKPKIRSKRCFLIFPIQGSEKKGLVSVEVKKKKGEYDMKLLAVDIPMASGPDQRIFLIGDEEEYKVGGGLISELRDPVVRAMAATKEFDDLDQIEDEEDAKRELQEAERKHQEEIEKLEKDANR